MSLTALVAAAESAEALLKEAEQASEQASRIVLQVAEAAKKALGVSHDAIRQAQHALAAAKIALESEEFLRTKESNVNLSDSASLMMKTFWQVRGTEETLSTLRKFRNSK